MNSILFVFLRPFNFNFCDIHSNIFNSLIFCNLVFGRQMKYFLLQYTLEQNEEKISEILSEVHNENTSVIQYNDENSLSCVLALAYYSAQDSYAIYRELQGGEGFADLVFVPKAGNSNPAMIIEPKRNKNTGIALNQIKDKKYIKSLKDYHGKVLVCRHQLR